jgi:hypothetical protein
VRDGGGRPFGRPLSFCPTKRRVCDAVVAALGYAFAAFYGGASRPMDVAPAATAERLALIVFPVMLAIDRVDPAGPGRLRRGATRFRAALDRAPPYSGSSDDEPPPRHLPDSGERDLLGATMLAERLHFLGMTRKGNGVVSSVSGTASCSASTRLTSTATVKVWRPRSFTNGVIRPPRTTVRHTTASQREVV